MYKLLKLEIKEKEPENAKGKKNHQQAIILEKSTFKAERLNSVRSRSWKSKEKKMCKSRHSNDE